MACRQCYAKHVGEDVQKVSKSDWLGTHAKGHSCAAYEAKAVCSVCGGTGYIVPQGGATAGMFGKVTYPPCKHCHGTGFCEKNPW